MLVLVKTGLQLVHYMKRLATEVNIKHHVVHTSKFSQTVRCLFISDVHQRTIPKSFIKWSYDFVLIGGDLVEGGVPLSRVEKNIQRLSTVGPCYYVFGNNDREVGEHELLQLFSKYDVKVLSNRTERLETIPMQIVGIDDGYTGTVDIDKAFEDVDPSIFTLFMTHSPLYFSKVEGIDLEIAGHHHGGQIRFLNYGIQPVGTFTKRNNRHSLISNGFGTTALPLRLGAESEVHSIQIVGKK